MRCVAVLVLPRESLVLPGSSATSTRGAAERYEAMLEFTRGVAAADGSLARFDEEALAGLCYCPKARYNLLPMAVLLAFSSFPIAMAASPPPAVPDCNVGTNLLRASCFCDSAAPLLYADIQDGCRGYFVCVDGLPGVYLSCLGGRFNQATQ
eukprot:gene16795-23073_t